eukprot:UN30512
MFFNGNKSQWVFSNKARMIEGDDSNQKIMYLSNKNANNVLPPVGGWKKKSPPGSSPSPKVICTSFEAKDEIEVFSKKKGEWLKGKILKVIEKNKQFTYKCKVEGIKKASLTISRQQLRAISEKGLPYWVKQFCEFKNKKINGDHVLLEIIRRVQESII